jgi:hypothetical protein
LTLNALAIGLGSTVATSCIGVNYPTVAFRCNPRQQDNCPDSHTCCSDDASSEGGALPSFMGKNIEGGATPFFAGMNNALGTRGLCVRTGDIPMGSGLLEPAAVNCPIPCNPTWADSEVSAVCGPSRVCCQTSELQPSDCVLEGDVWRPATGADINVGSVTPTTMWTPGNHETHQDPGGTGCLTFAGGAMNDSFADCVANLTVADQRGFCMALGPGQACPTDDPTYLDACEQINMGLIPAPGATVPGV